jgi:hypothetical protein
MVGRAEGKCGRKRAKSRFRARGLLRILSSEFHPKGIEEEDAMNHDANRAETDKPVEHSDNEKSKLPERDDEGRKQGPNDRPGKQSGEGEAPVG